MTEIEMRILLNQIRIMDALCDLNISEDKRDVLMNEKKRTIKLTSEAVGIKE